MTQNTDHFVQEVFRSPFADDSLFVEWLGGSKTDPGIIARYLSLPMRSRPEISCFFDRDFYLEAYPDIAEVDIDPIVHFMRWGVEETRSPHPLINVAHILALGAGRLPERMTIDALHDVLCRDLVDPSPLFSLEFYRSQLTGSKTPEGGLLKHFLQTGLLQGLRPIPSFDPISYYRQSNRKSFDLRSALRLFAVSRAQRLDGAGTEPAAHMRAELNKLNCATNPLRFNVSGTPDLTVILVLRNDFARTLLTIASLRDNYAGPIELILVNSGSADETRHLSRYVTGARVLTFEANIGVAHGFNAGLGIATADAVLFLSHAVELAHGAVAAALSRLESDPGTGAVGGKLTGAFGVLQEAGCIIWRDGSTAAYLRDQSPLIPEANFVRDVDFCSLTCLLSRTGLVRDLGGLDAAFAGTCYEDADLCIRIRNAGYRVVYDPSVVMCKDTAAGTQNIAGAHQIFLEKHRNRLAMGLMPDGGNHLFARSVDDVKGRVLLIEDHLPLRRLGSGFVRSNDIVRMMSALGYHVTVYPIHPNTQDLAAVYADFPATVEIVHDRSLRHLDQFLRDRYGFFSTIWIARSHNLNLVRPLLEQHPGGSIDNPRVVLDTEAIEATREELRHGLFASGSSFDLGQSIRSELRNAGFCRTIIAVNDQEARQIQELGFTNVKVVGHIRSVALTSRSWKNRAGMLFIGAIHTQESPNLDSLRWFVEQVLPLIEAQLGYETHLTIAGYSTGNIDLSQFRHHPRMTLRGPITDVVPLYDSCRVFVAPTRYAAGLPYKIHEAASYGVPVVATEVLRRQLGWENGKDLLAADASDPAAFARQVVTLYQSEALWSQVRDGAAQRIRNECAGGTAESVIAEILR